MTGERPSERGLWFWEDKIGRFLELVPMRKWLTFEIMRNMGMGDWYLQEKKAEYAAIRCAFTPTIRLGDGRYVANTGDVDIRRQWRVPSIYRKRSPAKKKRPAL